MFHARRTSVLRIIATATSPWFAWFVDLARTIWATLLATASNGMVVWTWAAAPLDLDVGRSLDVGHCASWSGCGPWMWAAAPLGEVWMWAIV